MKTAGDVKARRDQIAAIPANSDKTPAMARIRADVLAWLDEQLAADVVDGDALWAEIENAMVARVTGGEWAPPRRDDWAGDADLRDAPPHRPTESLAEGPYDALPSVEPAPTISPRTGKPKRKYTRRKKA